MTSSETARSKAPWRPDLALLPAGGGEPFVPWPRDTRPAPAFLVREIPTLVTPSLPSVAPAGAELRQDEPDADHALRDLPDPPDIPPDELAAVGLAAQRLEEARQAAWDEGHAQGVREGQRRAEAELAKREARSGAAQAAAAERQAALQQEILHALHTLRGDVRQLHAPLGRLALHLAEQLLRGELRLGGQAVARLVENALEALGPHPLHVTVRLNPEDLAALGPLAHSLGEHVALEAAGHLRRGSVEAVSDDMLVQDLVENRLDALAAQLLGAPAAAGAAPASAP